MPPVGGGSAIPSQADIAAGQRMRAAGAGGSIPTDYSEESRQAAIKKQRAIGDKTTVGAQKGDEEQEGESWIDKAQRVADVATFAGGFVPLLNIPSAAVQALSGAIDVGQGQYGEAGLRGAQAGLGLIPGGRLLTKAGTKGAAAVATGMPGARAVTGWKAMLPAISPASWKPALIAAGGKPVSTTALKFGAGLAARMPSQLAAGSGTKFAGSQLSADDEESVTDKSQEKPPKKSSAFVYRHEDGKYWAQGLTPEEIQQNIQASLDAEARRKNVPPPQRKRGTVPRKPTGEVDVAAWDIMTGQTKPRTYDEINKAIEITKPYNYDPLELDQRKKARFEKIRKEVESSM